jgi:hypothetical protein
VVGSAASVDSAKTSDPPITPKRALSCGPRLSTTPFGWTTIHSGLDDLDEILGGLLTGDNVVWLSDDLELCILVERLMPAAAPSHEGAVYVTALATEGDIRQTFGDKLFWILRD